MVTSDVMSPINYLLVVVIDVLEEFILEESVLALVQIQIDQPTYQGHLSRCLISRCILFISITNISVIRS